MKNILNKLLGIVVLSLVLIACKEEKGPESTVQRLDPIVLDASAVTSVTLDEDSSYTYQIAMPENQILPVHLAIGPSSQSTAIAGRDYTITWGEVSVPALAGMVDVTVNIPADNTVDSGETIYINLSGSDSDILGLSGGPVDALAVTVNNVPPANPAVAVELDWGGEFVFFGTYYNWNQFIDIDIYFDDFSGSVAGYSMATGDAPEVALGSEFSGDGSYDVIAYLYAGLAGNGIPDNIPVTLSIFKGGANAASLSIDLIEAGILDWTGDTADDTFQSIGTLTISGGGTSISFTDSNGDVLGTITE